MVLAMMTRPNAVNCRVYPSQLVKATHDEPVKEKEPKFKEKGNTIGNRVLIGSQVHTMSSGPSKRGSGH